MIIRPNSDISSSSIVSGTYADINEVSPSDTSRIITSPLNSSGISATYVCGLQNPATAPGSALAIVRYRACRFQEGRGMTLTVSVYESSTLRATGPTEVLPYNATPNTDGSFTDFQFNADLSAVGNLNNLRLRFEFVATSGSIGVSVQGGLSWAEIELLDASGMFLMI